MKNLPLHWKILIGITLGFVTGIVLSTNPQFLENPLIQVFEKLATSIGKVFVKLLKMVVMPLVFASIFMAIVRVDNVAELGKIGKRTLLLYALTTALAVLMGIVMVNLIHPGDVSLEAREALKSAMQIPQKVQNTGLSKGTSTFELLLKTFTDIVPENIFSSLSSNGKILQVIFFAVVTSLVCLSIPEKAKPVTDFIESLNEVVQKLVDKLIGLAPYFLFFLVSSIFMKVGLEAIRPLLKYALTVLLGLFIHGFVVIPALVFLFTRKNPYQFLSQMTKPLLMAWSSASSAATLPVTMQSIQKAGVSNKTAGFVLPLGATINMDGTALYESVAVIFIAGLLGIELSLSQQGIIFITATLAAMGAAAIPGAGLVTMGIVLSAVGLPLEAIGIVLAIDALLDQFRTMINVWGDSSVAFIVDKGHDE